MDIGSNVKKLMAIKTSLVAIPKGGNVTDGIKFLSDKEKIIRTMQESLKWVKDSIGLIRTAGEPNPFKNADEETIAGELLRIMEEKRQRKYEHKNCKKGNHSAE
jgi:hypothetical protein